MSAPWHVHLSPDAEAAFRDATRPAAAALARAFDGMATTGPGGVVVERGEGDAWTGTLRVGDHEVTIAGRDGDARIVVVRIILLDRKANAAQRAADLLPAPIARRDAFAGLLQGVGLDLRYTLRAFRRTPLFTAVVVLTLAIGFGGGAALLDIVRTVYAGALPFGDGDRLVRIRNSNVSTTGAVRRYNLTSGDYHLLRDDGQAFSDVVAMAGRSMSLVGDGPAERVSAVGVSPGWMRALRIRPLHGRDFSPDEEAAGADAGVALITHALWQRRFGSDPAAVGATLRYDGGVLTVIGVMPPNFRYPYSADIWTPWTFPPTANTSSSLNVVARLIDGATMETARADGDRLHAARAAANLQNSATGFDVATSRADLIREDARTVQALAAAVVLLFVLACVNVANLLVARFTARRSELGVRAALGGRRDQQLRQLVLEAFILFGAGTAGGLLLASTLRQGLTMIVPEVFRTQLGFVQTGVGVGSILLMAAIGLACGLGVGLAAALRAVRADTITLIRAGGKGSVGSGDRRLFDGLVVVQLSLSLVLLVGASLLIGRFRDMSNADPGFDLTNVATMRVTVDQQERYRSPDARVALARALEERLAAVPGVEAVGITSVNPLCCGDWGAPVEIEGRPVAPNDPPNLVGHSYVSPTYFDAMRIPLVSGAGFDPDDRPNVPLTVVIDEAFARMAWPGEDAVGKRVRLARPNQEWRTVIGVVPVTEHEAEMTASWYLPYLQDPMGASAEHLHMMVRRQPSVTMQSLHEVVQGIDPMLPVYGSTMMQDLQLDRTSQDRLGAVVSGVFAVFGLLLAGFSLYGLLSYSVELRRGELGVRLAFGASAGSIVALILRQAGFRLAIGTLLGLGLSVALNQVLRSAIEGLPWISPWALLGLAALMGLVTLAAAAMPALKATRVDPIASLR